MTTKTRETYTAAELFENNAPNVWAVMKRATPGARQFNGEIAARCPDEETARQIAAALNVAETAPATQDGGAPRFRIMMQDGLDWVAYTPAQPQEGDGGDAGREGDGRAVFREFHGRKPRAGFRLFLCHPDTRWDGIGGYTVPKDGWRPQRVL